MNDYVAQGGSMTKDGKPQQFMPYSPMTSMDLEPYVKHIEDVASKMKAIKTAFIQNPGSFNLDGVNQLDDPTIRGYFRKMYEDKISLETLSTNRLEEAAKQIIATSPDYHATNLEIQKAQHFLQTGRLEPNKDDLSSLYKGNSVFERNLSLELSPTYQSAMATLKNNYMLAISKGDKNANKIYSQGIAALQHNENIYNEGHDKLLNYVSEDIPTLYYGIKTNAVTDQIIKSGNAFAYTNKDIDRTIIDTGALTTALLKQKESSLITTNAIGSDNIKPDISTLAPNSNAANTFKLAEAAYNAAANDKSKPIPDDIILKYKSALAAKNAAEQGIISTYNSMSTEDKNKVLQSANPYLTRLADSDAGVRYALFNKTKTYSIEDLNKGVAKGSSILPTTENISRLIPFLSMTSVKGNAQLTQNRVKYIFSNIHPNDVINKQPDDIIRDFTHKGMILTANDVAYFKSQFNQAKYDIAKAVENHSPNPITVPIREIVQVGNKSLTDKTLELNAFNSFYNGQLIDINGKALNKEILNSKTIADNGAEGILDFKSLSAEGLKSSDLNNLGEASVTHINTGGSHISTVPLLNFHVPVRDAKTHNIVGYKNIVAGYEGNNQLVKQSYIDYINRAAKNFNSPIAGSDAMNSAYTVLNTMGSQQMDANGVPMQKYINDWKQNFNGEKTLQITNDTKIGNTTIPGNTLHVAKQGDRYIVTPLLRDKSGNSLNIKPFTVDKLDDILTWQGISEAANLGADRESLIILNNILTNQSK